MNMKSACCRTSVSAKNLFEMSNFISNELKQKDTVSIKFIDKNISSKIEKIN